MYRKTYFIDIDGTIFKQPPPEEWGDTVPKTISMELLPEAAKKIAQWHCEGHAVVITTARPESMRSITKAQLELAGILYDQLVMGIGQGPRILINDYIDAPKAIAYNVAKNVDGLANID